MERFFPEILETTENSVSVEADSEGNIVVVRPEAKYLIVNQDEKVHTSNDVQRL